MAQTITTNLPLNPGGVRPVIHLSQYDKTARTLSFLLTDETGTYSVPSGASATIRGTKPDRTGFEYPVTLSGTTASVDLQDQMTVCAGKVPCEIRITGADGSILGTANFILDVERSALSDSTVISKTDLPLIEKAAEAYDATKEAAAAALVSEKNAKASETAAASSVSAAAASQAAAKTSEANAKTSETNAKTSETNAKTSETAAASSASAAKASQTAAKASETNAKASETAAASSASAAKASQKAAKTSETAAASSASSASDSATTATKQATAAASSASAAKTSEIGAASSATSAAASAETAAGFTGIAEYSIGKDVNSGKMALYHNINTLPAPTAAEEAKASADAAAESEGNASESENAAKSYAEAAASSASAAKTSETNAAASETAASASAKAAKESEEKCQAIASFTVESEVSATSTNAVMSKGIYSFVTDQVSNKADQTALTSEADRAKQAEGANATAISDEATRAQGAEKTNADNITAETARAKAAEKDNSDKITQNYNTQDGVNTALKNRLTELENKHSNVEKTVSTDSWTAQDDGSVRATVALTAVYEQRPEVYLEDSTVQVTAATYDSTVPALYLYATAAPSVDFKIIVKGAK